LKAIIYPITEAAPNRLAIVARPRGNDWLCEEISALSREGIEVLVSMLTDEEANELGLNQELSECDAAGINFVNVAIPDRSVPSDRSEFLQHVEQLAEMVQKGRFVGVHCRASIGRSSILVVSVLMRLGWNREDAFRVVESARGCSIPDTTEQREWVLANIPWQR
jgi:protein-tyrosine phosphatase